MTRLVKVYRDIAELNLRVWGDQWTTSLGRLTSDITFPKSVEQSQSDFLRVWGHPRDIQGEVARKPGLDGVTLQASGIPEQRWVELRVVFPRDVLKSTGGAIEQPRVEDDAPFVDPTRVNEDAFERILAEEGALDAEAARGAERLERVRRNLWWILPMAGMALVLPAVFVFLWIASRHGRDRRGGPEITYVREPPSDDSPALVGALAREGGKVGPDEFLATIFDLIRRKYFLAEHETVEHKTWLGLKTEFISDLRVKKGTQDRETLPAWDKKVYDVIHEFLPDAGQLVSKFGEELKSRAKVFYGDFQDWQRKVDAEIRSRRWIQKRGRVIWGGSIAIFFVLFVIGFAIGMLEARTRGAVPIAGIGIAVPGATNAIVLLLLGLAMPRALTQRSGKGAELARGWDGLRRYLEDFSAMKDAPPASVALWETSARVRDRPRRRGQGPRSGADRGAGRARAAVELVLDGRQRHGRRVDASVPR